MENLDGLSQMSAQCRCSGVNLPDANTISGSEHNLASTSMPLRPKHTWKDASAEWRSGEFFRSLPPKAISEFESLVTQFCCQGTTVVFTEEQKPNGVLFLLEGQVKLTMNSSGGKRLMLGVAGPGEILGLAAVVTGSPYQTTAVAQFPCTIAALPQPIFFDFLLRHPVAWQNSARQLAIEHQRDCERLRILGHTLTASTKLAMLLLQWSAQGERTELSARIRCSLTHEEIGEHIGLSRETVTRSLNELKNHELLEQHGSSFFIPNLRALQIHAGRVDC